jgi:nicotinamide riboside kinase
MRIAMTGAHGTGKSTLAQALGNELGLQLLPTPGRAMALRGLPINRAASVTSQAVAWLLQLRHEERSLDWVSARSLIDVLAYATLAAERGATALENELVEELTSTTRTLLAKRYDLLVYLPPLLQLVADDVRDSDPDFQRAVDSEIRGLIDEWDVDHIQLDPRDPRALESTLVELRRRGVDGGASQ